MISSRAISAVVRDCAASTAARGPAASPRREADHFGETNRMVFCPAFACTGAGRLSPSDPMPFGSVSSSRPSLSLGSIRLSVRRARQGARVTVSSWSPSQRGGYGCAKVLCARSK